MRKSTSKKYRPDEVKKFEKALVEKGPIVAANEALADAYFAQRIIGEPEEIEINKDGSST